MPPGTPPTQEATFVPNHQPPNRKRGWQDSGAGTNPGYARVSGFGIRTPLKDTTGAA